MRLAVFTDIHDIDVGFERVETDIKMRGFDLLVCLDDAILGGPLPMAVVQSLRNLNCPVVMGNMDA